jgi:hypothetical protein
MRNVTLSNIGLPVENIGLEVLDENPKTLKPQNLSHLRWSLPSFILPDAKPSLSELEINGDHYLTQTSDDRALVLAGDHFG